MARACPPTSSTGSAWQRTSTSCATCWPAPIAKLSCRPLADVSAWSDTQKVEADNPAWVPGELEPSRHVRHDVHEHLEHGHPGLRGDLPPGGELPVKAAAVLVARAFAVYAEGDWDACDRLMAQGRGTRPSPRSLRTLSRPRFRTVPPTRPGMPCAVPELAKWL